MRIFLVGLLLQRLAARGAFAELTNLCIEFSISVALHKIRLRSPASNVIKQYEISLFTSYTCQPSTG